MLQSLAINGLRHICTSITKAGAITREQREVPIKFGIAVSPELGSITMLSGHRYLDSTNNSVTPAYDEIGTHGVVPGAAGGLWIYDMPTAAAIMDKLNMDKVVLSFVDVLVVDGKPVFWVHWDQTAGVRVIDPTTYTFYARGPPISGLPSFAQYPNWHTGTHGDDGDNTTFPLNPVSYRVRLGTATREGPGR